MKIFTTYLLFFYLNIIPISAQHLIFSDDFEAGTLSSPWVAQPGSDYGAVGTFRLTAPDSNHVVRLGKFRDGNEDLVVNRLDLALDLSLYSKVLLQFDIAHYGEETHPQDGIYVSTDGGNFFTKIYSFNFEEWNGQTMASFPPLGLTLLARRKQISLNDQTVIRFQQYGSHDFTGSSQYSDGIQLDNIRVIAPEDIYTTLPFKENFENEPWHAALSVGSITNPNQHFSPFGVIETIHYDSLQGSVLRMGSQYDKCLTTNALDLKVDLSAQTEVELLFKILNNFDETHPEDGILFSSDGGRNFTKVFNFDLELWREKRFGAYPPININRLAHQHGIPLTSQFVIRFQQHGDDDFTGTRLSSDGIYLDDIELREVKVRYATYPFLESFEEDSLAAYWRISMPDTRDTSVTVTPTGKIALVSTPAGQALALGSTVDRFYNTNAIDLYINLSQTVSPELSFSILNHYDETHPQDGIYFSQDAGRNFVKVYHFDGSHWANRTWGRLYALDIQELAAQHQLVLTDQFVIRFQQHDDDDFTGTRAVSDGIYLDNISIQEPDYQYYTTLPFVETFESDSLASYWRINNLAKTVNEKLIRPGGQAMIVDKFSYSHPRALALGRVSDGELTASAYDLHLDLAYQSDLELNFHMYSHTADYHSENGIWVSNNGGRSYKHAYNFRPYVPQQYIHHSINLDSLFNEIALDYTNQVIIRFQHVGDRSFLGEGSFASGAFLDDIVVTNRLNAPNVQDIQLNYQPDTDQQQLYWPQDESVQAYRIQVFIEELSMQHLVDEQTTHSNSVSFLEGALIPGHLHYVRIKSVNRFSESDWSTPVAISANSEGQISLSTLAVRFP
ncbi:MAG: hypothetical protein AAF944_13600 [Bacteroidota bacterium]